MCGTIFIPTNVTAIHDYAFYGNHNLYLELNISFFVNDLFVAEGCTNLTEVNIPTTVTFLGDWTFAGTNSSPLSLIFELPFHL